MKFLRFQLKDSESGFVETPVDEILYDFKRRFIIQQGRIHAEVIIIGVSPASAGEIIVEIFTLGVHLFRQFLRLVEILGIPTALEIVKSKLPNEEKSALEIWKKALENVTPQVEVKSRRVGGATFQVPTEIRADRKESISMKNLIIYARKRGGKTMADKLAAEIVDAFNDQGGAFKRKEDMHRMAEANRAFAHFRF